MDFERRGVRIGMINSWIILGRHVPSPSPNSPETAPSLHLRPKARTGAEINTAEPGTVARTCTLTPATGRSRMSVVKSQVEDYRAKAKEYARLTAVTKSLREGRRYRKLAEMYGHSRWAKNQRTFNLQK